MVPQYDIKGSVSQFDENVIRNQKDLGVNFKPFLNLGISRDAASNILGLDLSVLRMLILGALNWAIEWYRPGMLSASEVARHATTMICEGITARR